MNRTFRILSLELLTAAFLGTPGGAEPALARQGRQYTIEQFLSTRSYSGPPNPAAPLAAGRSPAAGA